MTQHFSVKLMEENVFGSQQKKYKMCSYLSSAYSCIQAVKISIFDYNMKEELQYVTALNERKFLTLVLSGW